MIVTRTVNGKTVKKEELTNYTVSNPTAMQLVSRAKKRIAGKD